MGSYMGNVGHLMQHWTLCELLTVASDNVSGLNYIDAHAMAPWATQPIRLRPEFVCVRDGLSGKGSAYERAWHRIKKLHQTEGYPSSAAFVREIWKHHYSLLLCDRHQATADKIDEWLSKVGQETNCKKAEPFRGDWRRRFSAGLPAPLDVCLPEDSLTLVSFDPYKYDRRSGEYVEGENVEGGDLYPEDLVRVLRSLAAVLGGILLQMSTYSTAPRHQNSQEAVIRSIDAILSLHEFDQVAIVREDKRMMSLVYARHVEWGNRLDILPEGYDKWRSPQR